MKFSFECLEIQFGVIVLVGRGIVVSKCAVDYSLTHLILYRYKYSLYMLLYDSWLR